MPTHLYDPHGPPEGPAGGHQPVNRDEAGAPSLAAPLLFADRVEQAILRAQRTGEVVGIALVAVHCGGDEPCEESIAGASELIVRRLRRADSVSRVGPAILAVLLNGTVEQHDTASVAASITGAIGAAVGPCTEHGGAVRCRAGTSVYPFDGADGPTLLAAAHEALGRHELTDVRVARVFDPGSLARDLRGALEHGELSVAYQPQVSAADGSLAGVEALARWHHPAYGQVPPEVFIPIAERTGEIVTVGAWVLRQALHDASDWRRRGLTEVTVAVNVSAAQVLPRRGEGFQAIVDDALGESGWKPDLLELELTETLSFTDQAAIAREINAIARMGVRLGADDFGVGKSVLAYLRDLPLNTLKIDRGFVTGLPSDARDAALVDSLIYMAHRLGMRTVAEGVATSEQAAALRRFGCDDLQGYLYAKPLSAWAVPAFAMRGVLRRAA